MILNLKTSPSHPDNGMENMKPKNFEKTAQKETTRE
jgi:hypothetical protein